MVGREPGCGLERQPQLCSTFFGAVVSGLSREGVDLFSFACDHCVEVKVLAMCGHLPCNCMSIFFSDVKDKLNYCLVIKNFNNEF